MVEGQQQAGHVTERRLEPAAVLQRSERIALEVDEHEAFRRPQDLAEMEVAVDPGQQGRRRRSLDRGQALPDDRLPGTQVSPDRLVPAKQPERFGQVRLRLGPEGRQVGRLGRTRRERPELAGVGQRGVELGQCAAQLDGVLRGVFEGHCARRHDPGSQPLGCRFECVVRLGDQLLEEGHGGDRPVRPDVLGRAGQRGNRSKHALLGEVGQHLELGIDPRADPAIRLEQQAGADHHRRMRLVCPERTLVPVGDVDRATRGKRRQRQAGPADQGPAGVGGHDPTGRDRPGQGSPGTVARLPLADDSRARSGHERDEVPVRRPVIADHLDQGEDRPTGLGVGRASAGRPDLDGVDETQARDAPPLPGEPAPPLDQVDRQRRRDGRVQSLIMTCLTTV